MSCQSRPPSPSTDGTGGPRVLSLSCPTWWGGGRFDSGCVHGPQLSTLVVILCVVTSIHVSLSQSLFPQFSRFDPCTVRAVFAQQNQDEVLGGPAKNAHRWGLFRCGMWGILVLEDCLLEIVDVQVTVSL